MRLSENNRQHDLDELDEGSGDNSTEDFYHEHEALGQCRPLRAAQGLSAEPWALRILATAASLSERVDMQLDCIKDVCNTKGVGAHGRADLQGLILGGPFTADGGRPSSHPPCQPKSVKTSSRRSGYRLTRRLACRTSLSAKRGVPRNQPLLASVLRTIQALREDLRRCQEAQQELLQAVRCNATSSQATQSQNSSPTASGGSGLHLPASPLSPASVGGGHFVHAVDSNPNMPGMACPADHIYSPLFEISFCPNKERTSDHHNEIHRRTAYHNSSGQIQGLVHNTHLLPHIKNSPPPSYTDLFTCPETGTKGDTTPKSLLATFDSDDECDLRPKICRSLFTPPPLKNRKRI